MRNISLNKTALMISVRKNSTLCSSQNLLSRIWLTVYRFGLVTRIIGHLQLATASNKQSAVHYSTHLVFSVCCLHQSSSNGFILRTVSFLWVLKLSPCLSHTNCLLLLHIYYFLKKTHSRLTCLSSQSHVTTDGQSVSMSWCQVYPGTCDQILFSVWKLLSFQCGAPSVTRGRVFLLPVTVSSI
jgi:hypothetical protein